MINKSWLSFEFVGAGLADNSEITAEELTTKPALPEFVGISNISAANSVITAVEVRAGFVQRLFVSNKSYLLNPPLHQFPLVSLSTF
ncbi:MAG: hypothetical protein WBV73_17830 [Phormidium sp.]